MFSWFKKVSVFRRYNYEAKSPLTVEYESKYVEHYKDNNGQLIIITLEDIHGYSRRITSDIEVDIGNNNVAYVIHNPYIRNYHFGNITSKTIIGATHDKHIVKYVIDDVIIINKE